MSTPALARALRRRRATWLFAGAAALTLPFACSQMSPDPAPAPPSPAPATAETNARVQAGSQASPRLQAGSQASPRLHTIRARFRGVLDPPPTGEAKTATIELPPSAGAPVRLSDDASHVAVSFALEGASDTALAVSDGIALYEGAAPGGGDILHKVGPGATEDFIFFTEPPARREIRYHVDVGAAAGLRLVANTLEFLDRTGTPRLRVSPPYLLGADGARHRAEIAVAGCAVDQSPRAPWGRPVTGPGAPACAVAIRWPEAGVAYPALLDPVWGTTFNTMEVARTRHTITLLNPTDPKSLALITGGFATAGGAPLATAELYDPLSRRFSPTGSMNVPRGAHTATLLTQVAPPPQLGPAQPVLIAGGRDAAGAPLDGLEVYDPASGLFVADTQKMTTYPRFEHTATLVADNQVLLAGGITIPLNQPTNTAYLYTFTSFIPGSPGPSGVNSALAPSANTMASPRTGHAAVRLNTGDVLLSGGFVLAGGAFQALQSAELWSPGTGMFGPITTKGAGLVQMSITRGYHTATLLDPATGQVLITGGLTKTVGGIYTNTIDLYADGTKGSDRGFVQTNAVMAQGRSNHTATLLTTGDVLIAGGFNGPSALSSVEIFSPKSQSLTPLMALSAMAARGDHAAILLNAGDSVDAGRSVLVTGGSTSPTLGAAALPGAQILLRVNGDPCTQDDECLSGHCADVSNLAAPNAGKMCCDTACNEVCKSCSSQGKGGGADGICGFASNSTELGWTCVPKSGEEVEILQGCDGQGKVIPFASNKCTPNTCEGNRCAKKCPCSDAGYCTDASVEGGSGQGGGGGAGGSSSASGAGGGGQGLHCEDRRPVGLACTEGRQCDSGYCVDGYCCNVACTGQCEACDVTGKIGYCTPAGTMGPEPPHTAGGSIDFNGTLTPRKPCDGTGTGCTGLCGGVKTSQCDYPGSEHVAKPPVCAADGPGFTTTSYSCDGKGSEVSMPAPCGGFRCDGATACKTGCATDEDCITDYVCLPGGAGASACKQLTGPLCDGKFTLRRPVAQGGNVVCPEHYTCPADATACRTSCDSVDDCVDGFVCDAEHKCVEQLTAPPLPSCACRAASAEDDATAPWALSLSALALASAARRRRWV